MMISVRAISENIFITIESKKCTILCVLQGILYLHADAAATPKDMYAKMGFEIVETVYEYYLEW